MGGILSAFGNERLKEYAMTYAREGLLENREELAPIFEQHWADVTPDFENVALGFDWDAYAAMESQGVIHFMVAREDFQIVGYHLAIGQRHIHSMASQIATTAFFFLLPQYRMGWTGVKLFQEAEKSLKALGIQGLYVGCKADRDLAPVFVRLGYHHVETMYAKVLA